MNLHNATIHYRPAGDTRPIGSAPAMMNCYPDDVTRTADVERYCAMLRAQDYEVLAVETATLCAACEGVGYTMRRPKAWRKRTPPPRWMMTRKACEACQETGIAGA